MQKNAENIRFASQGEFDEREDGIPIGAVASDFDAVYDANGKQAGTYTKTGTGIGDTWKKR